MQFQRALMAVAVGGFSAVFTPFSHSIRLDVEYLVSAEFLEPSMANSQLLVVEASGVLG